MPDGLYRSNSDVDWYSDALGYDLEQDSRWDDVDPSGFYPDPSLAEWGSYRNTVRRAVCREDFEPAGLPVLPTEPCPLGCSTPASPVAAST